MSERTAVLVVDDSFEARWIAWQVRGLARDAASSVHMTDLVSVVGFVLGALLLYVIYTGR